MNRLNETVLEEIKSLAEKNNHIVSLRVAQDIIKTELDTTDEAIVNEYIYRIEEKGIIFTDSDDQEDYASQYSVSEVPFVPADVIIATQPLALYTIAERLKYDEITLEADFQRNAGLWSDVQQSQLIESIMLQIPIPAFYFYVDEENDWKVIDGLQRLTAIKRFVVKKELKLCGLEYLSDFETFSFDDLPRQYARRINEATLQIYRVEKSTPQNVVFNIFKRLNTGGIVLEPQEIRHALYQGPVVNLINRMVKNENFLKATGYAIRTNRMLDREYATRFIAFTEMNLADYNGSVDMFLSKTLQEMNLRTLDEHELILQRFDKIMQCCFLVFGKYAFRKINEKWHRGPINKAIFELWSHVFSTRTYKELDVLIEKREVLLGAFKNLLETKDFDTAIKASDKYSLQNRMKAAYQLVEDVLHYDRKHYNK